MQIINIYLLFSMTVFMFYAIFTHLNKYTSLCLSVCIGHIESRFLCFGWSITDMRKLCQFSSLPTVPGKRLLSVLFNEGDHERGREIKRKGDRVQCCPHSSSGSWLAQEPDNLLSHSLWSPNARWSIMTPHAMLLEAHSQALGFLSENIVCDSVMHSLVQLSQLSEGCVQGK